MPDSACVGLAVRGLQQLPDDRNSAIIKKAFVGWRSYKDLHVVALECTLQVRGLDVKLSDSKIGNATHCAQQFECRRSCRRRKGLEFVLRA
eukprot:2010920-Pleurochrysis_carterae.AAC.1